jgi:pyridoxine 5-phosphate synthase
VEASLVAERAGASAITVHLREDRRHILDTDLFGIHQAIKIHLNQEMAPIPEMLEIAMELRPDEVCLVPERREELTTEGGLDAAGLKDRLQPILERLSLAKIGTSLFIDPEPRQIEAAAMLGADFIEVHTGTYANLADADLAKERKNAEVNGNKRASHRALPRVESGLAHRPHSEIAAEFSDETREELQKIRAAVKLARSLKLKVNAGHGLNYQNCRCYSRNRLATYRPCYCRPFVDSRNGARRTRNAQIDQRQDPGVNPLSSLASRERPAVKSATI